MNFEQILICLLGGLIGIIAYFLQDLMKRFAKVEVSTNRNTTDIQLVTQEADLRHEYLTKEFSELKVVLKELTVEMKQLNSKMK